MEQERDSLDHEIIRLRDEKQQIYAQITDAEAKIAVIGTKAEEKQEQLYRKFEETHYQRGYSLEQMHTLVEEAGMEFLAAYDAETKQAPTAESERIYIIAGEKGK